ncbi:PR domain zinc finger protein 8-like [Xyrauchen texanus]|uniref:PR domain zinc finger protein 8-like n=1 Tax=Xyrauchen texanus TaxID=154827 RepID=UPI0022426ACA|nr:PR domain zinc finger protein 8-like [Xyrauchen texanus]
MEHSLSLWTYDSKFLHHNIADFFTSVQVTQDIPAGTSFGPCVLHNTFYDPIAFIALKSFDKRNKSYVFRVDPEATKGSPLVVPWLRLVQAAMNAEDQNTEAFLKGGQLHFQTIRDVKEGEELLVWYDEVLSHLLGFGDLKTKALTDDSDNISDTLKSKPALGFRNALPAHLLHGDLPGTHAGGVMSTPLNSGGSYYYAPEHGTRTCLTVLPSTFTPLGVSVQNWCAKCNLSFRMTSDLVFHMRSHHKKEFAAEAQVKRRREEKLTCPICNEYFRERHHLSRHMTSHN